MKHSSPWLPFFIIILSEIKNIRFFRGDSLLFNEKSEKTLACVF